MAATVQNKSSYDDGATARTAKGTGLPIGVPLAIAKPLNAVELPQFTSLMQMNVAILLRAAATAKPEPPTTSK